MRVHSISGDVCGPSLIYMHWDSSVLPIGVVVPLVGAPFIHCLGSIHSLVPVEY